MSRFLNKIAEIENSIKFNELLFIEDGKWYTFSICDVEKSKTKAGDTCFKFKVIHNGIEKILTLRTMMYRSFMSSLKSKFPNYEYNTPLMVFPMKNENGFRVYRFADVSQKELLDDNSIIDSEYF